MITALWQQHLEKNCHMLFEFSETLIFFSFFQNQSVVGNVIQQIKIKKSQKISNVKVNDTFSISSVCVSHLRLDIVLKHLSVWRSRYVDMYHI